MANSLVYNVIARDQTGPGLAKAAANIKRAEKMSFSAEKAALGAAFGMGTLAAKLVLVGGAAAVAASALAPAAGAVALLPAAGFAAAGSVTALALAFNGLGDALGETVGTAEYAEQMKALAPAGREMVTVLKQLEPAWKNVKRAVQQATLAGLAKDLKQVAGVQLPVLKRRLAEIGAGWNAGFKDVLKLAGSRSFVADTDYALRNVANSTRSFAKALAPVISGLRHIGVVGAAYLPELADKTLLLAQRFERWALAARKSGQIEQWIDRAKTTFGQLWTVTKNVAATMRAVFQGGGDQAGQGFLVWLVQATTKMRAFTESAAGQEAIGKFFAGLGKAVDVAAEAWAAFTAEGTPVFGMLSLIYRIARPLLETWEDWIPAVAGAAAVLLPLAVSLRAVYQATGLVTRGAELAARAIKGIGAASAATPWGAITTAAFGLGYALGYAIDHADELAAKAKSLAMGMVDLVNPADSVAEKTRKWALGLAGIEPPLRGVARQSQVWADVLSVLKGQQLQSFSAMVKFNDQIERNLGLTMSADQAAIRWEDALDGIATSAQANGRSLDIHSAAGRSNRQAILGAIEAAAQLRQTNLNNKVPLDVANEQFRVQAARIRDVAARAGIAGKELDGIVGTYVAKVTVDARLTGQFRDAMRLLGGFGGAGAIGLSAALNLMGNVGKRAGGGPVKAGSPYLVGEQGPELIVPDSNGTVLTAAQTAATGRGGGGGAQGPIVLRLELDRAPNNAMEQMFVSWLRKAVSSRGGNVQFVLGG